MLFDDGPERLDRFSVATDFVGELRFGFPLPNEGRFADVFKFRSEGDDLEEIYKRVNAHLVLCGSRRCVDS